MRGHLRKRSKATWTIALSLGRDPANGKKRQQWVSVKGTKKDVVQKLAELLHQLNTGGFVKPSKLTLADFLTRWQRDYVDTNVRPRTADGYRQIVENHLIPELGNIPFAQLQPSHIQEYYARKLEHGRVDGKGGALSAKTVLHHHRTLSEASSHAIK
ncbi:MAG: N-terminal phage integrase SAM-like domain-containing protein [Dehalococcoidia bacterium]